MSHSAKLEYLKCVHSRYQESNKRNKSKILDEFCLIYGVTRKHAIKLLNKPLRVRRQHCGPRIRYNPGVLTAPLKHLWEMMGRANSKKIKAGMQEWLRFTESSPSAHLFTDEVKALLLDISASSIERMLRRVRWREQKGKSTTRPNKHFMKQIPIQAKDWNVLEPGTVQADTVAHCGESLLGSFVYSLTATDIYSGWTENRATWNKGMSGVIAELRQIEARFPFVLRVFKTDSGTEFMNYPMKEYLESRRIPVKMVRSRPYRKDDNCYVEQKNYTHVRELFGYERLRDPKLVSLMNEIYSEYWNPLQNFFMPSTKLLRKTRIGARIKKEFEPHKTPYQRIMECPSIAPEQKKALQLRKEILDPYKLSQGLQEKLRHFFELVRVSNTRMG